MLAAGVGGIALLCDLVASTFRLAKEGARVELARDTLGSRERGGMEMLGDAFRDRHFLEKDDPILDAKPLSGEFSAR